MLQFREKHLTSLQLGCFKGGHQSAAVMATIMWPGPLYPATEKSGNARPPSRDVQCISNNVVTGQPGVVKVEVAWGRCAVRWQSSEVVVTCGVVKSMGGMMMINCADKLHNYTIRPAVNR